MKPFLSSFDAKRVEDRHHLDPEVALLVAEYKRARAHLSGLCAATRTAGKRAPPHLRALAAECPEGQLEGGGK